ncbi:MAG: spermidine/putrescine ABC transporter substrate-binding protein [Chloroflexi bacterium]|nr:spermidine/putrescine ABC transporter substrate-binding protein [Chloroflexota bacterium]
MRKFTVFAFLLLVMMGGMAAQAQDAGPAIEPWACPESVQVMENKTLNIFNWATYIGENTIPDFENLCGVTVTLDYFDSNESMLTRLRQGNPGYDIVIPSDYAIPTMIEEGLLLPLDHARIPNLDNLMTDLREAPFDPESKYAVPYLWGTFGIGYNVNSVEEPVSSWMQFFEHDGAVAWTEDSRIMLSIALLVTGHSPNSSDPDEIEVAKQFLLDHSDNVVIIAADDGQEWLAKGDVDMAIEYNGDIFQINLDCECEDFTYVIPQEGSGISSGFIAIPTGAQNPDLAQVFIDYILDPQVGAEIANFTTYPSPNQVAVDAGLIDPIMRENPGIYPPEEMRKNLYFLLPQDEDTEQLFNDIWTEIKIALQAG